MELNQKKFQFACPCITYKVLSIKEIKDINQIIKCNICGKYQHKICIEPSLNMEPYYICPKCQIDKSDLFLEEVKNLIRPTIFSYNNNKFSDLLFEIDIDDFSRYSKNDLFTINCIAIGKNSFINTWPGYFKVIVNGKEVFNISDNDCTWRYYEKRKIKIKINEDKSDNIIYKFKKKTFSDYFIKGKNNVRLSFQFLSKNITTKYVISIDIARILTMKDVMKKIPYGEFKLSNENIRESIDFIEPLSLSEYISIPGRGINCKHLKCFDIKVLLESSQYQQIYDCPFCKKKVNMLYIDTKMKNLLEQYKGKVIDIDESYKIINIYKRDFSDIEEEKKEEGIINIDDNINHVNKINNNNNNIKIEKPNKKNKIELIIFNVDRSLFPFYKNFQNNINFNYIKKYAYDHILPQFLNHKQKRREENKNKKINEKNNIREANKKKNSNNNNNNSNNFTNNTSKKKNKLNNINNNNSFNNNKTNKNEVNAINRSKPIKMNLGSINDKHNNKTKNIPLSDDNDEKFIDINKIPYLINE